MTTLLIRLAGPMQSWGGESKYDKRFTWRVPSKSAVIGLAAAALGIERNASIEHLAKLRFGCRTDRDGVLLKDFQTTIENGKASHVIIKHYLADAVFLAGLEGDGALLCEIDDALKNPVYPLFLGRRSCPPEGRICLGLRDCSLEEALSQEPPLVSTTHIGGERLRVSIETSDPLKPASFLRDAPVSYNPEHRMYGFRRVAEYAVPSPAARETAVEDRRADHDPMTELEV